MKRWSRAQASVDPFSPYGSPPPFCSVGGRVVHFREEEDDKESGPLVGEKEEKVE
jgi:hypothetical protein